MNTAGRLGLTRFSDWLGFLAYLAFIFAAFIIENRASDKYPLLNANDRIYLWSTIPTFIVVGGAVWASRRTLLRPAARPGFAFVLAAAVGFPAAFLILGTALLVNGALDRGPATEKSAVVLRAVDDSWDRQYVLRLDEKQGPVTFALRRNEHVVATPGDHVTLEVMPGRLGRPWVLSHLP